MRSIHGVFLLGAAFALSLTLFSSGCSKQQSQQISAEPSKGETAPAGTEQGSAGGGKQTEPQTPSGPSGQKLEAGSGSTASAAQSAGSTATEGEMPSESEKEGSSGPSSAAAESNSATSEGQKPLLPPRTSLAGRWLLTLSQNGTEFKAALLEFQPTGEANGKPVFSCRLIESTSVLPPTELKQAEVTGQDVHLIFTVDESSMDFRGRFQDGKVLGNVFFGAGRCDLARLDPTQLETLKNERLRAPAPGLSELQKALQADAPMAAVEQFCRDFPSSPLSAIAYGQLLLQAASKGWDQDQVKQIAQKFIEQAQRWGKRFADFARITVGLMLANTNYDPEVSLEFLERAEREVPAEILSVQREAIEAAKAKVRAEKGRRLIGSDDPKKQAEGARILTELRDQRPFDPAIAYALARYAEQQGRTDDAVRLYAEVAVLPMAEQLLLQEWASWGDNELPSEALARLWKKKHGSTNGLEEFLDQVYSERVYSFAKVQEQPAAGTGHVILCELFTGSQCPPCVAADIALGGVARTYPETEVVVLRYHQHIPGPDPMANPDTTERFEYYQARGTPTLVIDGRKVPGVGGFLVHVPEVYARIRRPIEAILGRAEPARPIQIDLKAVADNGVLKVTAKAQSDQPLPETVRLRLVLAEDEVSYVARNGIRKHEMIVRKMLGGPAGIAPQNGQLSYEGQITLSDLRAQLESYLANFEKTRGYRFPARPLDLRALHVVAFVQDDATREVWQTALTPVKGDLTTPSQKPEKAETKKASASKTETKKQPAKAAENASQVESSTGKAGPAQPKTNRQTPTQPPQPQPSARSGKQPAPPQRKKQLPSSTAP